MPTAPVIDQIADTDVVIVRDFDAPARLLFKAHTRPEYMMKWFGPEPWPLTFCEMDFREGGTYRMAMTGPDGQQGPFFGGKYLEIVPDRKIVWDDAFELDGAQTMVVTVTFEEHADGETTTLRVHTRFASPEMRAKHMEMGYAQGMTIGGDQLAAFVETLR